MHPSLKTPISFVENRLKQPEDEPSEEGEEHILNSGLNSALLYDLLLGKLN